MAARSPRYPGYNLETAIQNIAKIHAADRTNPIEREVAVKHLGYSGASGASDKASAALLHYGLLDKIAKGEVCVSQLAVDILHPEDGVPDPAALQLAAFNPRAFQEIKSRFPDDHFSTATLQSFLVRQGFIDAAVVQVAKIYQENLSFLKLNGVGENGVKPLSDGAESDKNSEDSLFGGASVGDYVQWEIDDVLQFPNPMHVVNVHESGDWVFVEGGLQWIPMDQVKVLKPNPTTPPIPPAPPELKFFSTPSTLPRAPISEIHSAAEREWVRTPLGKGVFARILVTEDLSDSQIEKLRTVLKAMKESDE